jgi:hypothetical protein
MQARYHEWASPVRWAWGHTSPFRRTPATTHHAKSLASYESGKMQNVNGKGTAQYYMDLVVLQV